MKSKRNETGINKNSLWGLTSFDRENWRQTLLLPAFEVFKTYTWGRMRGNVLKLIGRGVGTGGGRFLLQNGRKAHSQHLSIESNDPKRKFSVNVPDYLGTFYLLT